MTCRTETYFEQSAEIMRTDSTCSRFSPLGEEELLLVLVPPVAEVVPVLLLEPLELESRRPVTSTLWPACFESSALLATRTYVEPLPDMLLDPVPEVPAVELVEPVVDPVLPVPEYEPELPDPIDAFVRIHSPPREEDVLPAVPVVPVAPVDDWLPRSRHPVTVIVPSALSLFWLVLLLVPVCAASATAHATANAAVAPVHTRFI